MTLHPVLAAERYLNGDQRNRATLNGIWQLPVGFQLMGKLLDEATVLRTAHALEEALAFSARPPILAGLDS